MHRTLAETIINFLLGASWAIMLLGALVMGWSFLPFGFLIAGMAALVGSLFGLFLVVLLEVAGLQFEKVRLLERQTRLLEKLAQKREGDDARLRDH